MKYIDTTDDDIGDWVPPSTRPPARAQPSDAAAEDMEGISAVAEEESDDVDEDSDMEIDDSVGIELNQRLLATAAQRESGTTNEVFDEEFQEWLRKALADGEISGLRPGDLQAYNPEVFRSLAAGAGRLTGTASVSRLRPARSTLATDVVSSGGRYAAQDAAAFSGTQ